MPVVLLFEGGCGAVPGASFPSEGRLRSEGFDLASGCGHVDRCEADEFVDLIGLVDVRFEVVNSGVDRCDEDAGSKGRTCGGVSESAEMRSDVGDQCGVEPGQTLDECCGARCAPKQVVQSSGAIEICDLQDERPTELVSRRSLISEPLGERDESGFGFVEVLLGQAHEQRVLVREVLIERSDRDASSLGDVIGGRVVVAERFEKTSSLVEDACDEFARSLLTRPFAQFSRSIEMRVARHEQYSHNSDMQTITVSTTLDAPADVVWPAATTPHAFVHVAKGMLRLPAAEHLDRPWRVGDEIRGWTFLFGVVPFSIHRLSIESIDEHNQTIVSDEGGGMIRSWRHEITTTPLGDNQCQYVDRIDIDAGPMTPVVAAFAAVFYRYRQRRWRSLAPLLAATFSLSRLFFSS